MIDNLKALSNIEQLTKQGGGGAKEINSSLPVKIKVLGKLYGIRYMLQIGNIQSETKSLKELEVGQTYLAMMKKTMSNSIMLSGLIKQPKIMEFSRFFKMDFQQLHQLHQNAKSAEDFFSGFKHEVMHKLAASTDRHEFWFWTNIMLSLQQGVYTIPFYYDEKEHFLQLRKRAAQDVLDFYAVFPNLGEIEGAIKAYKDELFLELTVQFPNVKRNLIKHSDELKGVTLSRVSVGSEMTPLYEFSNALLDMKG